MLPSPPRSMPRQTRCERVTSASFVHERFAVVLKPLPYREPQRIVTLSNVRTPVALNALAKLISVPDFQDWHDQSTVFDAMAYYGTRRVSVLVSASAEYARLTRVTREFFRVFDVQPVAGRPFTADEEKVGEHFAAPRVRAILVALFGTVALTLALAGIYGLMAYTVAQRSREIGLRMALGATAQDVRWMMLRRGTQIVAAGLLIGLVGAATMTQLLTALLFEIKPTDGITYASVVALLGVMSTLAIYRRTPLPKRRPGDGRWRKPICSGGLPRPAQRLPTNKRSSCRHAPVQPHRLEGRRRSAFAVGRTNPCDCCVTSEAFVGHT